MAQADYVISPNPTGLTMRTEVNQIFQAILTNNSGSVAPTTTQAGMFWGDISNASTYYLKIRNHTNDGWVSLYAYDVATKTISPVNTPAGNISSTTVQGAINELDTEKQANLVSGTNIKTVNSTSLLGSGDIAVQPTLVSGTNIKTVNSTSLLGSGDIAVQPTLVSGTNIKTVNGSSLLGSGDMPIYTGFKNYIINGKKAVNQRGLTSTDNNYNQDRWYKVGNNWYQGIEGDNNLINGKTYTISWVGSATAGYYVGTATSTTINSQTFTSISNGGNFTLTISAGQNLWIKFASDATGSTFNFVQIEEGSVATPFEQRPCGLELSLCQRYYEISQVNVTAYGTAGMPWQQSIPLKVVKRVTPTVVIITPTGQPNIGTITSIGSNVDVVITTGNVVNTGQFSVGTGFTASAEL